MFSVFGLSAELSPSASTDLRVQIDVSDPMSLPFGPLIARYDKTSNVWNLTGEGWQHQLQVGHNFKVRVLVLL